EGNRDYVDLPRDLFTARDRGDNGVPRQGRDLGWENGGTNSATRIARCFSDWRCGRRPLLSSLLCPIDSSAHSARGTLLRTTLVPQDAAAPMVHASASHRCVVGCDD